MKGRPRLRRLPYRPWFHTLYAIFQPAKVRTQPLVPLMSLSGLVVARVTDGRETGSRGCRQRPAFCRAGQASLPAGADIEGSRNFLEISERRSTIHPLSQELLDSLAGQIVSPGELGASPAPNKVKLHQAPLNVGTRSAETRGLRRETYFVCLNCGTQRADSYLSYVHRALSWLCSCGFGLVSAYV